LYDTVVGKQISMCGIAPTTAMLVALGGRSLSSRLIRWGHSGEAEPMATVVGYAGMLMETATPF
jgi:AmmeMemoRadiSam system protein B